MTDRVRERLIEILRVPIYPHLDADPAEAVADYLLDSGVTVQEWIPVKDRLPESTQRVIVCRKNGNVEQGIFLGVNGWWKVYGTNTKSVTHWMPMPQPPKGD